MPERKPKLTLRFGGQEIVVPLLVKETLIGRLDSNHVVIDDASVSRIHAKIELNGEGAEIADCGSSTGTQVNGELVDRVRLTPGDVVKLGSVTIIYSE